MLSQQTIMGSCAIVMADQFATEETKTRICDFIRSGGDAKPMPELLTRRQVAKLMKKSPTQVDNYARAGFIRRVHLGNSSRSSGFDADSVRAFLAGKGGAA